MRRNRKREPRPFEELVRILAEELSREHYDAMGDELSADPDCSTCALVEEARAALARLEDNR